MRKSRSMVGEGVDIRPELKFKLNPEVREAFQITPKSQLG